MVYQWINYVKLGNHGVITDP